MQKNAIMFANVQKSAVSKKELCTELGIHRNTLRRWLKLAGIETGRSRYIMPKDYNLFCEHIGHYAN